MKLQFRVRSLLIVVTIATSDSSGNPLAGGLSLAASLTSNDPFAAGIESINSIDGPASSVNDSGNAMFSPAASSTLDLPAVPEPSTLLLSAVALLSLLGHGIRRRRTKGRAD